MTGKTNAQVGDMGRVFLMALPDVDCNAMTMLGRDRSGSQKHCNNDHKLKIRFHLHIILIYSSFKNLTVLLHRRLGSAICFAVFP